MKGGTNLGFTIQNKLLYTSSWYKCLTTVFNFIIQTIK